MKNKTVAETKKKIRRFGQEEVDAKCDKEVQQWRLERFLLRCDDKKSLCTLQKENVKQTPGNYQQAKNKVGL